MTAQRRPKIPEWIDDGEYVDEDINDPVVRARLEDLQRRRNDPWNVKTKNED